MPSAAFSRSALAVTIAGFLPPISANTGRAQRPEARARAISRPTGTEPVNAIPSTSPATSARPVSAPPCTRLIAPAGKSPAASTSPSSAPVHGVASDGLTTTVLPAIRAAESMFTASARGKIERRDHAERSVGPERLEVAFARGEAHKRRAEPFGLLDRRAVGLDQVDRLLRLGDRLDARLARLQAHHRCDLDLTLGQAPPPRRAYEHSDRHMACDPTAAAPPERRATPWRRSPPRRRAPD